MSNRISFVQFLPGLVLGFIVGSMLMAATITPAQKIALKNEASAEYVAVQEEIDSSAIKALIGYGNHGTVGRTTVVDGRNMAEVTISFDKFHSIVVWCLIDGRLLVNDKCAVSWTVEKFGGNPSLLKAHASKAGE